MILMAVAALGASLIASPASANQTPVGEIQQSFAAPCEDIAQTRSQFAHRIGVQKKFVRSTPNSCELSYAGPKIPNFDVGKDEIALADGDDAQVGVERGEGVVGDLGLGRRHRR